MESLEAGEKIFVETSNTEVDGWVCASPVGRFLNPPQNDADSIIHVAASKVDFVPSEIIEVIIIQRGDDYSKAIPCNPSIETNHRQRERSKSVLENNSDYNQGREMRRNLNRTSL